MLVCREKKFQMERGDEAFFVACGCRMQISNISTQQLVHVQSYSVISHEQSVMIVVKFVEVPSVWNDHDIYGR